MSDENRKLAAPFPPEKVSWRIGQKTKDGKRAMALAYIDARDVMERLDEVCGVEGWQAAYPHANGKTVCSIGIKFGDEWVWKANGAGDTDIEAEKGALSDAFKRAAVMWGIGRYLYDVEALWVETEGDGKFARIAKHEYARLRKALPGSRIEGDKEPAAGSIPASRGAGGGAPSTAPAPANREDPADTYVKTAIAAMNTARSAEDLKAWWADQANAREDFGITKGGKRYALLWDAFLAKGTALKSQPSFVSAEEDFRNGANELETL